MVRRDLGYSPGEWDRLPWYHQTMFIQQMDLDSKYRNHDPDKEPPPDELDPFGEMSGPPPITGMTVDASGAVRGPSSDLAALGIRVIHTEFGD